MRKFALIAVALMLASALVPTAIGDEGASQPRAVARTVLFELFTCVNNTNVVDDENASAKLAAAYSRDKVAIIQWYKTEEGLGCPDSTERFNYYAIPESPRAFVDGRDASSTVNNDTQTYNTYRSAIQDDLNTTASASISGNFRMGPNNATVNATVKFSETTVNSGLDMYFFLVEDMVTYKGANNVSLHRYVARKLIAKNYLVAPVYRANDNYTTPDFVFTLSSAWNRANLGLVVALQSDGTRAVIQSKFVSQTGGGFYGVDLSPNTLALNVSAGKNIETTLTAKNTGSASDTIDFSKMGEAAAWTSLSKSNAALGPDQTTTFKVTIYVPSGTEARDYILTVRGASRTDTSKYDDTIITVKVEAELSYGVAVTPSKQEQDVSQGRSASFQIKVRNTGTLQDTIDLDISGGQTSWGSLSKTVVSLPPNGEESVTLTVEVPEDASTGRYDITVTAVSRADASKTGSSVATVKVSSGSTSGSYGADMQPRLVSKAIAPGASTSVTLTVSNTGTSRDTLDLSKMGDASSWTVLQPISLDLTGGSQGTVEVNINVPTGTTAGRYVVTVRATSRGDSTKRTESNITLDVATPDEPPKIVSVNHEPLAPTSKDVITITAVVSGTAISVVEVTYSEGSTTHPTQRMTAAGSSTFSYAIGPFKADTVIKYKVKVTTSSGKSATSSEQSFVIKKAPVSEENTPGFELLGALAAVGVCAMLLGRRRNH